MQATRLRTAIVFVFALFFALGCVKTALKDRGVFDVGKRTSSKAPPPQPAASKPASPQTYLQHVPKTLAILPFENNSVTDPAKFAPLTKGIPAMLTTDLQRGGAGIQLIERSKIESLLGETALVGSGVVNESAAIRAGKLLGAESIGLGSFIVLGRQVRIDARVIGVETGEVIMADSIMGKSANFMGLIQDLGIKIAGALRTTITRTESSGAGDIQAAVSFSKGLEALDQGDIAAADQFFAQSIQQDPAYQQQVAEVKNSPAYVAAISSSAVTASGGIPAGTSKTVEAEGLSFTSREDALEQALRAAVEQGVGVFVHSRTEMENFAVKKEEFFTHAQGYVTNYRVLKELQADGQHIVTISADVSLEKIKNDLIAMRILLERMERPMVMVLIGEQYMGMPDPGMAFAETEMTALLNEKGFDLVDKNQINKIQEMDQKRQALAGDMKAAQQLGLSMGAQYVVMGKAVVENAGEAYSGSGIKSLQAGLQLRVLQTQTGLILGSVVKNGVSAHPSALTGASQALRKAAQKAADDYLVNAITESFQDFLNNGAPLKLKVADVLDFQQYKNVIAAIEEVDGMVSVKKEGWNKAGGLLLLDLRFRGVSETLAMKLDGLTVDAYKLEVIDFAPERVDVRLAPAETQILPGNESPGYM